MDDNQKSQLYYYSKPPVYIILLFLEVLNQQEVKFLLQIV